MPRDFNIPKGVVDVCRYRGRKLAQLQIFYPSALRCCGVIGRFAHGKTMASKVGRAARWGLLASLKRRFGIQQAIFVFDSGMSSTLNLEANARRASAFCLKKLPQAESSIG